MSTVPLHVGLDYHSCSIQVCVVDADGAVLRNRRCANSVRDVAALVGEAAPERVAIESCCGAADFAEALHRETGWDVVLAHPGYVARMRHNPDKSDYSDARMLAELCRVGMVPPVWLAPAWIRDLRTLVRLRADIVQRRRELKTRILAVLRARRVAEPAWCGRWSRPWVRWLREDAALSDDAHFTVSMHADELDALTRRIKEVEARLSARTADDPVVARLLTMKGVGPVTAWTMRALIGRFDRFATGKQLARFCALTPRNASSGKRVADAGLVKAGDPLLKSVLIEAGHRLRRHEPRWRELSSRLQERGKPVSVAVAAVANRWVRWLHHEMKGVTMAA